MKLLYSGFDKFEVAFMGALPRDTLKILKAAREEATQSYNQTLVTIGPGKVDMHVAEHGLKGGYAFVTDTGPTGEKWMFKDNSDPHEWNIAVSVHASSLAVHTYAETRDRIIQTLERMGATVLQESVRRVDYAMDFLIPDFELQLDLVVAHGHAKVQPHYGEPTNPPTGEKASAVFRGRRIETITVGKMPGRQVTIYDKRKAAIEQRKLFWFEIWKVDRHDRSQKVWRVELRAGKNELKNRWQISTFQDIEDSIGDVFRHAAEQVRYVDDFQTDTNVSRQRLHPLWEAVLEHLDTSLFEFRSGLTPNQLRGVVREQAIENYKSLIYGNSVGLAVALGLSDEDIETDLVGIVGDSLKSAINNPHERMAEKATRARDRMRFV